MHALKAVEERSRTALLSDAERWTRAAATARRAGLLGATREHAHRAAEAAAEAGDTVLLARAALELGGVWVNEHRSVVERLQVREVQRDALDRLEPTDQLAGRLRARIVAEDAYAAGEVTRVLALVEEMGANRDPTTAAEVLSLAHHCLLGPRYAAERLALADRLIAMSGSSRSEADADALMGLAWRTVDLFLQGDARVDRTLRELKARLELTPFACVEYLVAALDVMITIRSGRLAEAERRAEQCYELGIAVGDADASGWFGAQLIAIRWYQGRAAEILPLVADLAHSPTLAEPNDGFFAALAVVAASAGQTDEARAALAKLRANGLAAIRQSSTWMASIAGAIEAAAMLHDADAAREGYELLEPFGDAPVMASLAVACFGSAHRVLGLAADTFGDLDLAVRHLEAAVIADLRIGNQPAHTMSSALLAGALLRRGAPGELERAVMTMRAAVAQARRLGMHARAEAWEASLRPIAVRGAEPVTCARDGNLWRIALGDRATCVPDCVGMRYLDRLLDRPSVEVSALDLASSHQFAATGSTHEMLDDRALASYRARVVALQTEIEEADGYCDLERASRARLELDALVEEVERAVGLAGASRNFHDDGERARTSVQKAIKRAIATISTADAVIGEHLRQRVVTGARCTYAPITTQPG